MDPGLPTSFASSYWQTSGCGKDMNILYTFGFVFILLEMSIERLENLSEVTLTGRILTSSFALWSSSVWASLLYFSSISAHTKRHFLISCFPEISTATVRPKAFIVLASTAFTTSGSSTELCTGCSSTAWKEVLWKAFLTDRLSIVQIVLNANVSGPAF